MEKWLRQFCPFSHRLAGRHTEEYFSNEVLTKKNSSEYHKINCLDEKACSSKELSYKLVMKESAQASEGRQVHSDPTTGEYPRSTWGGNPACHGANQFSYSCNVSYDKTFREVSWDGEPVCLLMNIVLASGNAWNSVEDLPPSDEHLSAGQPLSPAILCPYSFSSSRDPRDVAQGSTEQQGLVTMMGTLKTQGAQR